MIVYLKSIPYNQYTGRQHGTVPFIYILVNSQGEELSIGCISKSTARRAAASLGHELIEDINEAQLKALWRWKRKHGKHWRSAMSAFWLQSHNHPDAELFEQLREELGRPWLATFRLPEEPDGL